MLLVSAELTQRKRKANQPKLSKMPLTVLDETKENAQSVLSQIQRGDVHTVTSVVVVNTGLLAVEKEKIPLPALVK